MCTKIFCTHKEDMVLILMCTKNFCTHKEDMLIILMCTKMFCTHKELGFAGHAYMNKTILSRQKFCKDIFCK